MPKVSVHLLAENLSEQRALEAIFRKEISLDRVEVSSWLTSSAAVGAAELSLLEHPDRPIALVRNTKTEDQEFIEHQIRGPIRRILSRITPDGWHLALAIPDVDAWIMADPRIKQIFEQDEAARASRVERAAQIGDLARAEPIDREAIGRAFPEFRALVGFIEQHAPVPQTTTG